MELIRASVQLACVSALQSDWLAHVGQALPIRPEHTSATGGELCKWGALQSPCSPDVSWGSLIAWRAADELRVCSGNMERNGAGVFAVEFHSSWSSWWAAAGQWQQQDGLCLLTPLGINPVCWASPSELPWEIRCGVCLTLGRWQRGWSGTHPNRETLTACALVLQTVSSLGWFFSR